MIRYPLAKDGVFATIQGEGPLLGTPMVFVRLAGCSVGCANCDTDYRVRERLTAAEIGKRIEAVRGNASWVFLTGGEPADHDLRELVEVARLNGRVALVTSGHVQMPWTPPLDFLTVSPHDPAKWVVRWGTVLNIVPGLNGAKLADFEPVLSGARFEFKYVTPLSVNGRTDPASLAECLAWLETHQGWKLGVQAHKSWGIA